MIKGEKVVPPWKWINITVVLVNWEPTLGVVFKLGKEIDFETWKANYQYISITNTNIMIVI